MKVLTVILVAFAMADGKGSGPYLYQRPDGPAFFLPSEVVKPLLSGTSTVNPNQGSEASGSVFLQEYGPPKLQEISQNLLNQGLPDVTIDNTFGSSTQNAGVNQVTAGKVEEIAEEKPELSTVLPATAESLLDDNPPISAELPILDFEVKDTTSIPTELATSSQSNQESNVQTNQLTQTQSTEDTTEQSNKITSQESASLQSNQPESSAVSDLEKITATSVGSTESASTVQKTPAVQNIPDIIASLENEVLSQQAEINQAVEELASGPASGLVPEGFLEYGPPGFIEYGPPKDDETSVNLQSIISNETRRRRFTPRLRLGKK